MAVKVICVILLLELLCATSVVICQMQGDTDFPEADIGIRFLVEPDDLIVAKGKSALLHCAAESMIPNEPVDISWIFNDVPIDPNRNNRKNVLRNGSLIITKVSGRKQQNGLSDEGVYRCLAKSAGVALISRPAELKVAYLSKDVSISPSEISAVEGDVVRMSCKFDSLPFADVSWTFQNKTLTFESNDRYDTTVPGVLYITSIQSIDSGQYRCSVNNSVAKKNRRSTSNCRLIVNSKTTNVATTISRKLEFISPTLPETLIVRQGETLILECAVLGPTSVSIFWTHSPIGSKEKNVLNNSMRGVNIYKKSNVGMSDGGIYTCIASTRKPSEDDSVLPITRTVNVGIVTVPEITKRTADKILPVTLIARFECEAIGNPSPQISWFHNGIPILRTDRVKLTETELILKNTVSDDSGIYQCVAFNQYGSVSVSSHLHVIGSLYQPAPPMGLKCTPLNSTQLLVSWELSPHDNAEQPPIIIKSHDLDGIDSADDYHERVSIQHMIKKAYTIHYFPTDGSRDELQLLTVNRSLILNRLQPHTNYTIYVRTYNGKSGSDQSEHITCRTGNQERAIQITLNVVGPSMIFLQWFIQSKSKVKEEQETVNNISYKVQWKRIFSPSSNSDEIVTNSTSYTILDLQPNTEYEIRVLGLFVNDDEIIADSEWLSVITPSNSSTLFPTLRLNIINSTCLQVSWNVDETLHVDSVKLYYRKLNTSEDKMTVIDVPGEQKYYILSSLEADIGYNITVEVVAANNANGIASQIVQMPSASKNKTIRLALQPPNNLFAEPRSPNSIFVNWTAPKNLKPIFYNVYCIDVENNTRIPLVLNSIHNAILISNLYANTLYEVKVISCGFNNSCSNLSETVLVRTYHYAEEVIDNVSWISLNSSSIFVSWKHSLPSALSFVVRYSTKKNDPYYLWTQMPNIGNASNVIITNLRDNTKYYIMVQAKLSAISYSAPIIVEAFINNNGRTSSSVSNFVVTPTEEDVITEEQWLGLYIGLGISLCCISFCAAFIVFCRRRYVKHMKQLDERRQRQLFSHTNHEMAKTTFYNKEPYSNGCVNNNATVQIPLLPSSSGTSSIIAPNVHINDNSRNSDMGKEISGEEINTLLSSDSVGVDCEMDKEGGDSGYCDRRISQSPQLKDYADRRNRKSSDITIDDGFYENEIPL